MYLIVHEVTLKHVGSVSGILIGKSFSVPVPYTAFISQKSLDA